MYVLIVIGLRSYVKSSNLCEEQQRKELCVVRLITITNVYLFTMNTTKNCYKHKKKTQTKIKKKKLYIVNENA